MNLNDMYHTSSIDSARFFNQIVLNENINNNYMFNDNNVIILKERKMIVILNLNLSFTALGYDLAVIGNKRTLKTGEMCCFIR